MYGIVQTAQQIQQAKYQGSSVAVLLAPYRPAVSLPTQRQG